jgi:hypothetical protein
VAIVSSRLEDLRDLAQLLDDGKISQSEYELVKKDILEAPPEEWIGDSTSEVPTAESNATDPVGAHEKHIDEGPVAEAPDNAPPTTQPEWLRFVRRIPAVYWAGMGAIVITLLYGGTFAPVAWATAVLGGVGIVTKKAKDGRWMSWTAVGLGVVFAMVGLYFSGEGRTASPIAVSAASPESSDEIPDGSLGVRFAELPDRWNALDKPPYVLKGISTTPEPGPFDSFTYRFDGGSVLAGAYNPSDDFVYALMVRAGVQHEASATMYVHLCYLLYPGTQKCFDSYVEESGVFGKDREDLIGSEHFSSWQFDGNEWRLEIVDNIQTMRVLSPRQTAQAGS